MPLPAYRSRRLSSRVLIGLGTIGLVCAISGLASAQEPPPAEAAPAAEPAPAAPPPADPAPSGFQASFGNPSPTTNDTTTSPPPPPVEGEPKPLPWRGTTFTFNQAATTTTLGVGRDNIGGEDEYYGWDFTLFPNYYLLDREYHKVAVFVETGFAVEWTNSSDTTTTHEPYFKDLQIGAEYKPTFYKSDDKEYLTGGVVRARLIFPTSPISQGQGRILGTSLGGGVTQQIKLLGANADGLNSLTLRAGLTWSHLFSESYVPTNDDLNYPRQNARGQAAASDQLTGNSLDVDRVIPSFGWDMPLIGDLSWSTTFRLIGRFKHDFQSEDLSDCIQTATGPACPGNDPTHVTYLTNTSFDTSLGYSIYGVVDVNLGYNNETLGLAPDGTRRQIFYSPDAQFYMDIIANLDVIYDKASGRSESKEAQRRTVQNESAPIESAAGPVAAVGPSF